MKTTEPSSPPPPHPCLTDVSSLVVDATFTHHHSQPSWTNRDRFRSWSGWEPTTVATATTWRERFTSRHVFTCVVAAFLAAGDPSSGVTCVSSVSRAAGSVATHVVSVSRPALAKFSFLLRVATVLQVSSEERAAPCVCARGNSNRETGDISGYILWNKVKTTQ